MSKVFQALERVEGLRGPRPSAVVDPPSGGEGNGLRESPDAGEYERLAVAILQARAAAPFKTMMLASPDHGEGTSTVAAALARALADRAQIRVLLVDANLRSPVLADRLGAGGTAGLAEAVAGRVTAEAVIADTGVPNLRLVAAGATDGDAARLLLSPRLSALLQELAEASDLVILDAPPVLPYADALAVAAQVERVVLVTRAERTQLGHLERAKDELEKSGAAILGVVLNRKALHAPPWLQRYLNP